MSKKTELYQRAAYQRDCHRDQISGAWSINAKDFCKEAGIDYQKALNFQHEQEMEIRDEEIDSELARLEEALGPLTEKQIDHYRDNNSGSYINPDGYSYYFWYYVAKGLVA